MALPALPDLKAYARVEHSADDALLTQLLAVARAQVEGLVRRPLVAAERTFEALYETYNSETGASVLHLPLYPAASAALVVEDADGDTVAAEDYALDVRSGRLTATAATGKAWTLGPYTITATVGLSAHPDYATLIEPRLFSAILDIAADLYARRNPAAQQEGAAGAYVGWSALAEVLPRVKATLGDLIPRTPMRL